MQPSLQLSERADSRLDNLHVGLTLWDGVLRLGADVESWTANKLAVFAESPTFQTENDIRTLQVKADFLLLLIYSFRHLALFE